METLHSDGNTGGARPGLPGWLVCFRILIAVVMGARRTQAPSARQAGLLGTVLEGMDASKAVPTRRVRVVGAGFAVPEGIALRVGMALREVARLPRVADPHAIADICFRVVSAGVPWRADAVAPP